MIELFIALGIAILTVWSGYLVSKLVPKLDRLRIPPAILGGLIGLFLLQALPENKPVLNILENLRGLPSILINLVFATLMLGTPKIEWKKSLRLSGPNILMGHAYAWGQHWVGGVLALTLLPLLYKGQFALLAPLIAIGFQGGHGTAAGLEKTYRALHFEEGVDLGLGVATGGVLVGLITGLILFRILEKKNDHRASSDESVTSDQKDERSGNENPQRERVSSLKTAVSNWTVQMGFVVLTIFLAYALFQGAERAERLLLREPENGLLQFIPLFPIILLTSMPLNALFRKLRLFRFMKRPAIHQIGTASLDLLIVSAVLSLNLSVLLQYGIGILLLVSFGIVWNLCVFFFLGRLIYPRPWYAHGLTDYGGATATTATGLLLADVADPEERHHVREAYVFKQPFYEPFMGGGFVTALALPTIQILGLWGYISIVTLVIIAIAALAWFFFGRKR